MSVPIKANLPDDAFGALREYASRHGFTTLGDAVAEMILKAYAVDTQLQRTKGSKLLIDRNGVLSVLDISPEIAKTR